MKVLILPSAFRDLTGIGAYIGQGNPQRAASFVDEIEERCRRLGDSPRAYPLIPGREASGIRRCAHRGYLIFYRVTPELVEVIHVLHGARDVDTILFPDD